LRHITGLLARITFLSSHI